MENYRHLFLDEKEDYLLCLSNDGNTWEKHPNKLLSVDDLFEPDFLIPGGWKPQKEGYHVWTLTSWSGKIG